MYETHSKRCSLIPPLVSNNNLALLRCGYMCAGILDHISRHCVRQVIIIVIKDANYVSIVCLSSLLSSVLHRIPVFDHYYIITAYILLYHLCSTPSVSYSYFIIPWVFPAWYQLLYIYLLLHACAHNTVFNVCLWFRFIDTRMLIYARHLVFASPLALGSFDSPRSSYPGLKA